MTVIGDLTVGVVVDSVLIKILEGFLLMDFFNIFCEFTTDFVFDGEGTDSFFFV
jgi:hypothetical protein